MDKTHVEGKTGVQAEACILAINTIITVNQLVGTEGTETTLGYTVTPKGNVTNRSFLLTHTT